MTLYVFTRLFLVSLILSVGSGAAFSQSRYSDLCREFEKNCVWMKDFVKNREQVIFYKAIQGRRSLKMSFQEFKELRMSQPDAQGESLSEFEKERREQDMEGQLSSAFNDRMHYYKRKLHDILLLSTEIVTVSPYQFSDGRIRFEFENPKVFNNPLPQYHCYVANDTIRHILRSCTETGSSRHGEYETFITEQKAEDIYGIPGLYGNTGDGPKAATLILSPTKLASGGKGLMSGGTPNQLAFSLYGIMFYDKDELRHTVMFSKARETDIFNGLTSLLDQVNGAIIDLPEESSDSVNACAKFLLDIRQEVFDERKAMKECLAKDQGCPSSDEIDDFAFIEATKRKMNTGIACRGID